MAKDCKEVKTLIGPIELDILDHPQTKRRIVLLGDQHINEYTCPSDAECKSFIFVYLQKLFEQYVGTEYLDFFLEIPFMEEIRERVKIYTKFPKFHEKLIKPQFEQGYIEENFLHTLEIYFLNCFRTIKTQCEFHKKPIRFHYADVRSGVIHSETKEDVRIVIKQLQEIYNLHEDQVKNKHLSFLLELMKRIEDRDVNYFFRLTKIDKQLKRIDIHTSQLLHTYMLNHLKNIDYNYKSIQDNFVKLRKFVIGYVLRGLLDVYVLSRIIRHNMKQVIIYAGMGHTSEIKQFLVTHMGFQISISKTSKTRKSDSFQCISLKNVPQPWFS
jgi:hypothetical protein